MKKILAFAGSNNSKSINNQLVEWAAKQFDQVTVDVIKLTDFPMPLYGQDIEAEKGYPKEAIQLRQLLSEYDGYLIASPEHNSMMPAFLKNTFDWLSRIKIEDEKGIFANKPVVLVSTSPGGRGGMTNLQNMVNILPYWGADIKGHYSVPSFFDYFENGNLNGEHKERLLELIQNFENQLMEE